MITFLVVFYLAWCTACYFLQDRFIFVPSMAGEPLPPSRIPAGVESVWVTLADGSRVEAWFCPAPGCSARNPAPVVLAAHGNAELIDQQQALVEEYHTRGISVLLAEYPGYGRSGGKASQATIQESFAGFLEQVLRRPEVDAKKLIYHGRSLGSGAVAQLASTRPPAAMVLESPFRSVASFSWRYGVPSFLVRNPFRTDLVLAELDAPVVIIHGRDDDIVPIEHGRDLARIARDATLVELGGGHNDGLISEPRSWEAIDTMLRKAGVFGKPRP